MNDTDKKTLSSREAYIAMFAYLESLYTRTASDFLGGLLGSMTVLKDGSPADSAIWSEWLQAVEKAKRGDVNAALKLSQ